MGAAWDGFSFASAVLLVASDWGVPVFATSGPPGWTPAIWWFFGEDVPAGLARNFVSAIVTRARATGATIPFSVWNAIIPAQATRPQSAPDKAISLPFQGEDLHRGIGVPITADLCPCPAPWKVLADTPEIFSDSLERILRSRRKRLYPVTDAIGFELAERTASTDFQRMEIQNPEHRHPAKAVLSNGIRVFREGLRRGVLSELEESASFLNPAFDEADRRRRNAAGIPRIVSRADVDSRSVSLPRGCLDSVRDILSKHGMDLAVDDLREDGLPLDIRFLGDIRPAQAAAGEDLLRHDFGTLSAGTAFGKTVLAAWMIAQRARSSLVLVHRRSLLLQWKERLSQFLSCDLEDIGQIGGGKNRPTGHLDVALVQTLSRFDSERLQNLGYGFVVADECHTIPAASFERVANALRPRFFLGLSATPERRDGMHPVLCMQCGPIRHRVSPLMTARSEPFAHVVLVRATHFRPESIPHRPDDRNTPFFPRLCDALCHDEIRNELIASDAVACLKEGRFPLILTDRRDHVALLAEILHRHGVRNVVSLVGGRSEKRFHRDSSDSTDAPGSGRIIIATGALLGEGFDDSRLDTLLLATPVSWRGRLAQYAGRLHRLHKGKREVRILDYADLHIPVLARMFDRRCVAYPELGYAVNIPVTHVPGWPEDVAVPVDRAWTETHADSVRRLVKDGTDAVLAELFVQASWTPPPDDAEGAIRARSSAEAFLFRRLETLDRTSGLFSLNESLPIPLFGNLTVEIDLLCPRFRIAVEIDGCQHLCAAAYRRDREKDLALQRSGWTVLRFLAQDVTVRLGTVLDTILSTMA